MAEDKHTPGPWVFDGPADNIIVWSSPNNRVCFMTSNGPAKANARLIAAAPDLLEAMQGIEHFSDALNYREDHLSKALRQWIDAGRAAIAKAEGKE